MLQNCIFCSVKCHHVRISVSSLISAQIQWLPVLSLSVASWAESVCNVSAAFYLLHGRQLGFSVLCLRGWSTEGSYLGSVIGILGGGCFTVDASSDAVFSPQANPPPVVVNTDSLDTPPYVSSHAFRRKLFFLIMCFKFVCLLFEVNIQFSVIAGSSASLMVSVCVHVGGCCAAPF